MGRSADGACQKVKTESFIVGRRPFMIDRCGSVLAYVYSASLSCHADRVQKVRFRGWAIREAP